MSVSVCVCLSVRDHIFRTTRPIFTSFFVHVTCGRGSVLHWRRSDTLYTSGFVDNVISQGCSTSPAAKLNCSARAALGLVINCAQ